MKKTNSLSKKVMNVLSILAIVIASFSTFSISAQTAKETNFEDLATELAVGPQSCYTTFLYTCGLNSQEYVFCSFNNVYGKPYECTEYNCSGNKRNRVCVYVSK